MDGQRQYPPDPDRWFGDHPDDDSGRIPGQQGERYADPESRRDPAGTAGNIYAEPYADQAYGAPGRPEYGRAETVHPDQPFGEGDPAPSEPTPRRRSGRPVRVGRRSGLELPDHEPGYEPAASAAYESTEYEAPDVGPRYRAERIDRQALRRDGQTYQSGASTLDPHRVNQPGHDAPRPDQSRYDQSGFEQSGFERADAYPTLPTAPAQSATPAQPAQMPTASAQSAVGKPLTAPTRVTPAVRANGVQASAYPSKRTGIAILIGGAAAVVELLLVRVLIGGEFVHTVNASAVLGGLFAMTGVPMVGIGLYGLACGAASSNGPELVHAWLRPPLAYLPIGLLLLIAAGLAA